MVPRGLLLEERLWHPVARCGEIGWDWAIGAQIKVDAAREGGDSHDRTNFHTLRLCGYFGVLRRARIITHPYACSLHLH